MMSVCHKALDRPTLIITIHQYICILLKFNGFS
uniref:Uncharacterized protein n=1 Tax=Arundo donax TaxID=35708 RepID=A0A0A9GNY8_ARUDO